MRQTSQPFSIRAANRVAVGAPVLAAMLAGLLAACAPHKPAPPPPPVAVAAPLAMTMVDWDDYEGQFAAENTVDIRPRVSGYLIRIGFKDGDRVKKGQVLFEIDPRPYEAALDQAKGVEAHAQAALINAREQRDRGRVLLAAKAISQQAFESLDAAASQAEADLATARANVRAAALNVAFTKVVAPLDGRVSDRRVSPGNLVTADTTVLTNIVSLNPIWFDFSGPESLYLKARRRMLADGKGHDAPLPVQIQLQDQTTYALKGRIDFVDNQIDPGSGAIRERAVIENADGLLTPGMFGHLKLQGSDPYPALMIPDSAILTDLNRRVVYLVGPDDKVVAAPITPGPVWRGLRVVRAGLKPGDRVIIDGLNGARPGAQVRPHPGVIAPLATRGDADPGYVSPTPTSATPAVSEPASRNASRNASGAS